MTHLVNDRSHFAEEALAGFCALNAGRVRPVTGGVVRRQPGHRGKVAVVVGGGSGHYPAFAGYVGAGLADAAVVGDVFASPSTARVRSVAHEAARGGGVLLGFGNYAGDVLNFTAAARQLREDGIDTELIAVTDDLASATSDRRSERRGVAGDVSVFKIAGAAAERGAGLQEVTELARRANDCTRTFGIAFSGCVLPGADSPLFTVEAGVVELGLGIHGEPGLSQLPMPTARELGHLVVSRVVAEAPIHAGNHVAVLLNGLGSTTREELFVLWNDIAPELEAAGLCVVAPLVGDYVSSLDMAGISLTLTWLEDDLEALWLAPADSPALVRGAAAAVAVAAGQTASGDDEGDRSARAGASAVEWPPASASSQAAAAWAAEALERVRRRLEADEDELGRLDAVAGDGDHGRGMTAGSIAASTAAREAVDGGAGLSSMLRSAGQAWAERAGGTSGALWGAMFEAAADSCEDDAVPGPRQVSAGVRCALEAVRRAGGAVVGDKTMIDALDPLATELDGALSAGLPLDQAWVAAATAAGTAARNTSELTPRLGRAKTHAARSVGHPDAGATSMAAVAAVISPAPAAAVSTNTGRSA